MRSTPTPSPQVSVITATYNWSSVLRYAIQSVLWQSFQDFEMLIVGDACTDDSAQVVASFGDSRLRWYNLAQNSGNQSVPNNLGLEMARGTYVAYLGHDDVWYPTHLELFVRTMRETEADLIYSLTAQIGPPGSGVRMMRGLTPDGQFQPSINPPPSSLLHRRDLVQEIGGWKDFRTIWRPPDADLIWRAWEAGKRFVPVHELTVWKFPSGWRLGSYVEKACHEQAECVRRIREEPDFQYREALDIVAAYVLNKIVPSTHIQPPRKLEDMPPGWLVEQWRQVRGLQPLELEKAPNDNWHQPRHVLRLSRNLLSRLFKKLLRLLGE